MNLEDKILVTGSSGLVGTHLVSLLKDLGYINIITPRSNQYDLRKAVDVNSLFTENKPDYVFSLAAKVGGILDNKTFPADFYFDNILINAYIYDACKKFNVKKLISLGAGCGYPLGANEPLKESSIWDGFPQPESAPYSLAKKMMIIQSYAYRKQYNLNSCILIPSNLYGEHDNFNLFSSHVIPALIRKFYESKINNKPIEIWGDGSAKRDFIHAHDVCRAMVEAAKNYKKIDPLNIAFGKQYKIKDVVELLREISDFSGNIQWNTDQPSGQSSREFSTANLKKELSHFAPTIDLRAGLDRTYKWFASNYDNNIRL